MNLKIINENNLIFKHEMGNRENNCRNGKSIEIKNLFSSKTRKKKLSFSVGFQSFTN